MAAGFCFFCEELFFAGTEMIVRAIFYRAFVALRGHAEQLGFIGGGEALGLVFQLPYTVNNALNGDLS